MEYTARNLAPIEPAAFDGDPVKYNKWLTSFNLVLAYQCNKSCGETLVPGTIHNRRSTSSY